MYLHFFFTLNAFCQRKPLAFANYGTASPPFPLLITREFSFLIGFLVPLSVQARKNLTSLCRLVTALDSSKTPVVSVLDGLCIGSGYALAMGKYK